MTIWGKVKHFHPKENWGESSRVNGMLILLLDKITGEVKKYCWREYKRISPCIIHCAYETSGHSVNSQHYTGNAADFHFENISAIKAFELILKVLKDYQMDEFVGLGVYPDWYKPGFHLDVRGYKARWSQVIGKYRHINEGLEKIK